MKLKLSCRSFKPSGWLKPLSITNKVLSKRFFGLVSHLGTFCRLFYLSHLYYRVTIMFTSFGTQSLVLNLAAVCVNC